MIEQRSVATETAENTYILIYIAHVSNVAEIMKHRVNHFVIKFPADSGGIRVQGLPGVHTIDFFLSDLYGLKESQNAVFSPS